MSLSADQIIQLIVDQTTLPEAEVVNRIRHLQRSFNRPLDQLVHDPDLTFPQLLAQELNVDLGVPPYDYLYPELLFDEDPLILRIIPFTTVDKAKIKSTLRNLVLEFEDLIKYHIRDKTGVLPHTVGLNEELHFLTHHHTFVRDGIWMLFHSYSAEGYFEDLKDYKAPPPKRVIKLRTTLQDFNVGALTNSSLEDIVDRSELYRTFADNRIIRTSDPTKTFIPFSLVNMVMGAADAYERHHGFVQFPYISLESLRTTPNLEIFSIHNLWTKEIIGTEALQYCPNLNTFVILDEMGTLQHWQFPPTLSLPHLRHFEITVPELSLDNFDLSFLNNSPKLYAFHLAIFSINQLILPPFDNHQLLAEVFIGADSIGSIVLSSSWRCPDLWTITIMCKLDSLDLSPLQHCSALRELILRANQFQSLDLSPLQHCSALRKLYLGANRLKSIDLSPLRHCVDLQTLSLSNNLLTEIDLSPLANHPALESIGISNNHLQRIDLFPLRSCPNLESIYLKGNPIANTPKDILNQQNPTVFLAYDSLLRFPPRSQGQ